MTKQSQQLLTTERRQEHIDWNKPLIRYQKPTILQIRQNYSSKNQALARKLYHVMSHVATTLSRRSSCDVTPRDPLRASAAASLLLYHVPRRGFKGA